MIKRDVRRNPLRVGWSASVAPSGGRLLDFAMQDKPGMVTMRNLEKGKCGHNELQREIDKSQLLEAGGNEGRTVKAQRV